MVASFERVYLGGNLVTMRDGCYSIIPNGALAVKDGCIAWIGPVEACPDHEGEVFDIKGLTVTPGLIDCHTHIVFGGDRSEEFEQRLQGVGYEEIARRGGGILSTVRHTRLADEGLLLESARKRLASLAAEGVTTVEIKSGYGLDTENELKMLRVARQLGEELPLRTRTTFLGAHALHPDYQADRAAYIRLLCDEMLPQIAREGLADATDAFCENIAFDLAEVRQVFEASQSLGIPVKLHADQLSDGGGAALAAEFKALSADHVEFTGEAGIRAMAKSGTVAVLLPGAWYTLRETKIPPVELFRANGVPMAVSTDCNPGSSPVLSLQTMISMACTSFRMTPEEALAGVTCHAAKALGLQNLIGTLEVGKRAEFVTWDIPGPAALAYWFGTIKPVSIHR